MVLAISLDGFRLRFVGVLGVIPLVALRRKFLFVLLLIPTVVFAVDISMTAIGFGSAAGFAALAVVGVVAAPEIVAMAGLAALASGIMGLAGLASPSTSNVKVVAATSAAPIKAVLTPSGSAPVSGHYEMQVTGCAADPTATLADCPPPAKMATVWKPDTAIPGNPPVQTPQGFEPTRSIPDPSKIGSPGGFDSWGASADGGMSLTNSGSGAVKATISPDKQTLTQSYKDSKGDPVSQVITHYADGSYNVAVGGTVHASNSGGAVDVYPVASTQSYDASGNPVGAPYVLAGSGALGGTLSGGSTLMPDSGGTGQTLSGGASTGTGTGTGSSSGNCTSGDCATETTQLANKGLLQGIKDALTGADMGTAPADPSAKSGADISVAVSSSYGASLQGLKGWQLPAHVSQCPSGSFTIPGSSHVFSMDGHCTFASQNLPLLSSIFLVLWNLSALMIVIRL